MITHDELDLIHKYLEDNLTPDEITLFKELFNANPEFAREVKRYTDIGIALKTASAAGLKAKKKTRIVPFSRATFAYAAMFLLLLGVGSILYFQLSRLPLHEKLYAENFKNPFATGNDWLSRSNLSEVDSLAIQEFEKALNCMAKNEFSEAITILKTFNYNQHAFLMPDVEWFLALAYLQIGNIDETRSLLLLITNSDSKYATKATKIYEQIGD